MRVIVVLRAKGRQHAWTSKPQNLTWVPYKRVKKNESGVLRPLLSMCRWIQSWTQRLSREIFKGTPSVGPKWALAEPKRAQQEPKWSRNRPPGGSKGAQEHPKWSWGDLDGLSSKSWRTPRGRGAILGRFWGAQRGPKARQI